MHPSMLVGTALFFLGAVTVLGVLFTQGGARKSEQFRVLFAVLAGERGPGPKRALAGALAALGLGALMAFSGVAAGDRARARRCKEHCARDGDAQGSIGPSDARDAQGRVAFVACTCAHPPTGRRVQVPVEQLGP